LWHGANWTFVAWGLFHGAFLVIERLGLARRLAAMPAVVRHVYVMLVVMVGWVCFRADTLGWAWAVLGAMVGLGGAVPAAYSPLWYVNPEVVLAMAAGAIGSTPVVPMLARWWSRGGDGDVERRLGWAPSLVGTAAVIVLLAASLTLVAAKTYNPFIYFRF
jgi:alginate O-acetyltransferase complex protein AlgI